MREGATLIGYCGRCGARLEIRTTWNGHATVHYTLVSAEGGKLVPITRCPGCGEGLWEGSISRAASDESERRRGRA